MDKRRQSLVVVSIVLMSVLFSGLTTLPMNVKAATLFVGGTGPGNYTSIQSAVDAASPGDTVFVYSGSYGENIAINKQISLVGEERDNTVISPSTSGHIVSINATSVVVRGFSITGSWGAGAAIGLTSSSDCQIVDNNLTGNDDGLNLYLSNNNTIASNIISRTDGVWIRYSDGNTILNNVITGNSYGLLLFESHSNNISDNIISDGGRGIYLSYSNKNFLSNNSLYSNAYEPGIYVWNTNDTTFVKNALVDTGIYLNGELPEHYSSLKLDSSNTANGRPIYYWKNVTGSPIPSGAGQVILFNCTGITVEDQNLSKTSVGIHLIFSSGNSLVRNNVSLNNKAGVLLVSSHNNTIHENDAYESGFRGTTVGSAIRSDYSDHNTITNNIASTGGMHFTYSNYTYIANNTVLSSGNGLGVSGYHNIIANNTVSHSSWGIAVGWDNNRVENNTVFSNAGNGITLRDSRDSVVTGNTVYGNRNGIYLDASANITVENNNAYENKYSGIHSTGSSDNIISGNNASWNFGSGISFGTSYDHVLLWNEMFGNGITFSGSLSSWWSHSIDTSNTVNGKPVYYWKNVVGGSIPSGAGQVILVGCTNVQVKDQNVSVGTIGVILGSSSGNTIERVNSSWNTEEGILLFESHGNVIGNSTLSYSDYGIHLLSSNNNLITNNVASENYGHGVYLRAGEGNGISGNNISANVRAGIQLEYSDYNRITDNDIIKNRLGIYLDDNSNDNIVKRNDISYNEDGVMLGMRSHSNEITYNTISWNERYGIYIGSAESQVITNNVLVKDGIYMGGSYLEHWNSHTIDTSNTVNGKPVYYWKNAVGGTVPSGAGQIILANCSNVSVENQNVSDTSVGVQIGFSSDIRIANTIASQNNWDGILARESSKLILENNTASYNRHGVNIVRTTNVTMTNNSMVEDSIYISAWELTDWASHDIDTSNTVNGKPVRYWKNVVGGTILANSGEVILANCTDVTVSDLNISNGSVGILIGHSSGIAVTNNTLLSNSVEGISLWGIIDSIVVGNVVTGNNNGLHSTSSMFVTVSGNSFIENEYGIYLWYNYYFYVHHNNFIDNIVQTYGIGSMPEEVIWDDGYPSGGNYWSDYTGVDNCSGPNQDVCPDPDDIGDEPYRMYWFGGSWDRYPLMKPVNVSSSSTPLAPENLQASPGNQQVTLTWNAPYDGGSPISNYRIYRGDTSGGEVFLTDVGDVLIFTDTGLANGKTYYYRVSAVNALGEGPLSNEASATPATVPGPPLTLSAVAGDSQITLTWNPPADDGGSPITNYRIYRGTSPGTEVLLSELGNVLSYIDSGLTDGQTYYYKVSAVTNVGEGPKSNEASATPTTHPGAPTGFLAVLSGLSSENVTLTWSLSSDDGGGQDSVIGYAIYRGMSYDANATGYNLISSVPSRTSEFIDNLAGEGDTNNYFYRICAIDLNNKTQCARDQVAKFTKHLSKGMVLVSMPLIVQDNSTSTVFQTVSFVRILIYEEKAGKKHNWKVFDKRKPYSKLPSVNYTMAFWVEVTADSYFTIAGTVPRLTTIKLHEGWNFVSYPSFVDRTVSDTLSTHYQTIETFDPTDPPWNLKRLGDSDLMTAGEGYWIHVSQDYDWVITN